MYTAPLPVSQNKSPDPHPVMRASIWHRLAKVDEQDTFWDPYRNLLPKQIPPSVWEELNPEKKTPLRIALESGNLTAAAKMIHWGANPWFGEDDCDLWGLQINDSSDSYRGLCLLFQSLNDSPFRTTAGIRDWLGHFYGSGLSLSGMQWIHNKGLENWAIQALEEKYEAIPWQSWISNWGITPAQVLEKENTWAALAWKTQDLDTLQNMIASGHASDIRQCFASDSWGTLEWSQWQTQTSSFWFHQRIRPYYSAILWALVPDSIKAQPWPDPPKHGWGGKPPNPEINAWEDPPPFQWTHSDNHFLEGEWLLGMLDMGWGKAPIRSRGWILAGAPENKSQDEIALLLFLRFSATLHGAVFFADSDWCIRVAVMKNWVHFATLMARLGHLDLTGEGLPHWQLRISGLKGKPCIYSKEELERADLRLQYLKSIQEKNILVSQKIGALSVEEFVLQRI